MDKRLIGYIRLVSIIIASGVFKWPILEPFELECLITNFVYNDNNSELRESSIIQFIMVVYLTIASYYIIQTFMYIRIGRALNGKNTSLIRFIGILIRGMRVACNDTIPTHYNSDFETIEKVLKYRDNKMANMGIKESAEYMSGTGYLDHMLTRKDMPESRKALNYINAKLGNMGNDQAIEFIRGKK